MANEFKTRSVLLTQVGEVPPTQGNWNKGTILVDEDGVIWTCIESGSPGIWTKVTTIELIQESINNGEIDLWHSSGLVDVEYSTNGNQITINRASVVMYKGTNTNSLIKVDFDTPKTFTLTKIDDYFIVAKWNNGEPDLFLEYMRNGSNFIDEIPIARLCWDGSNIRKEFFNNFAYSVASKLVRKDTERLGNTIVSGFSISEEDTRKIVIGPGIAYYSLNRYELPELRSDVDNCLMFYHDNSGNWIYQVVTQYDNLHYDTGTGLAEISDGNYVVCWLFRSTITNTIVFILGRNDYTLDMAIASGLPLVPPPVETMCVFVGRIIVEKGSNTAELIQQAKNVFYGYSPAQKHNDLGGLQGGDTGQFYHLSEDEYNALTFGNEADSYHIHDHNKLSNIQGGNWNDNYHLTQSQYNSLVSGNSADLLHKHSHNNLLDLLGTPDEYFHLNKDQMTNFKTLTDGSDAHLLHTHGEIDVLRTRILSISSFFELSFDSLTLTASTINDWGIPDSPLLIIRHTVNVTINGIINPTPTRSRLLFIVKDASGNLSLSFTNESALAQPQNRIITNTGGTITLGGTGAANYGTIALMYRTDISRWQVLFYTA